MTGITQAVFMNQRSFVSSGSQLFTSTGTYTWVAPAGVTSVSVLTIGKGGNGGNSGFVCGYGNAGGGGGGGGALAYKNNISVTPGNSYTIKFCCGYSCFATNTVRASHGNNGIDFCAGGGGLAANSTGDAKYSGGTGGSGTYQFPTKGFSGGGGGAAGYSGAGGKGGNGQTGGTGGCSGSGGGGGGGGSATATNTVSGGGGGVGVLGEGSSGGGGGASLPGGNGSSGTSGASNKDGGTYGGGGGGKSFDVAGTSGTGGAGSVRIIWPGSTRSFPSTNAGNP